MSGLGSPPQAFVVCRIFLVARELGGTLPVLGERHVIYLGREAKTWKMKSHSLRVARADLKPGVQEREQLLGWSWGREEGVLQRVERHRHWQGREAILGHRVSLYFHSAFPEIIAGACRLISPFSSWCISRRLVRIRSYGSLPSTCVFSQRFCNNFLLLFQNCFMMT